MQFPWQALGIVRLRGGAEVTFRGRRSTLRVVDVWARKCSWQAQGIARLRFVVEKNVAATLGLACERCCSEGMDSQNCLARLRDVCAPMGLPA